MKRIFIIIVCLAMLGGCTAKPAEQKQYTATFLTLFDTVTTIKGSAESKEAFSDKIQPLHDELERYHQLFDIYNEYSGIVNLKTVNDNAANGPVKVDGVIMELLLDCKEYYTATNGVFNPAMGTVLRLWHDARTDGLNDPANAYLPDYEALKSAAEHTNANDIVLDVENSTVYFKDPDLKLDVGGIAKGWAVQKVCENAPEGLLLSVGGNVCATGPKDSLGTPWSVGIQNPNGEGNLHVLRIVNQCVVTSGNYQRNYVVNGKMYHHIIDPATLYPCDLWASVSIVCNNSGLADVLSTSLFLMDKESGEKLLKQYQAEAMWVDANGNKYYSENYEELIMNI